MGSTTIATERRLQLPLVGWHEHTLICIYRLAPLSSISTLAYELADINRTGKISAFGWMFDVKNILGQGVNIGKGVSAGHERWH